MSTIPVTAAYRLWSQSYDRDPNPLLALEQRVLGPRLGVEPGDRVIDLATGTGRWLLYFLARGVHAFGLDLSPEMLAAAAQKREARGRLMRADARALPVCDSAARMALCSFAFGYIQDTDPLFREMARIARCVIVSDLHPDAVRAGWTRSFRVDGQRYEVAHYIHSRERLLTSAQSAGLRLAWSLEAAFGAPEQEIFERAGKGSEFSHVAQLPAVWIGCWERK
jgi:SAM-dependent methyltransferase